MSGKGKDNSNSTEGYKQVACGLNLTTKDLKNKKLILIRHPKHVNAAELLHNQNITMPKPGSMSAPLLSVGTSSSSDDSNNSIGSNNVSYKIIVDKDNIHTTFRPILKGGVIGPAFDSSIAIVQVFEQASSSDALDLQPPITAYSKVPQVKGLRACMLPLGSSISQRDLDSRVAVIDGGSDTSSYSSSNLSGYAQTPSREEKKKKKRKSEQHEESESLRHSTEKKTKKDKKLKD